MNRRSFQLRSARKLREWSNMHPMLLLTELCVKSGSCAQRCEAQAQTSGKSLYGTAECILLTVGGF